MAPKNRIVSPILKNFFDTMPGAWGCKDEHSVFMHANAGYGKIVGLKHHEDVIGRSDFDMPCDTVNCAPLFQAQDKKVMETQQELKMLDIHPFAAGEWKIYIFTKTPLFDERKNVIGTIFNGVDITDTHSIELGMLLSHASMSGNQNKLLNQNSYMLNSTFSKPVLTERESEVLFYLLRGKTAKMIGLVLSISFRTVEQHIEYLRQKFNVANRIELIEIALSIGFLNVIPKRLFRRQLSIELKA